tara:strand:- start:7541 stop:8434 length:894 start_codon:yes stop_codon:yes gene_type:complete
MKHLLLTVLTVLLCLACTESIQKKGTVYAEINGVTLTLEEAKANIPDSEFETDSIVAFQNYKENWVKNQLILQEIDRIKLLDSPEVSQKVEHAKQEMLFIAFQEAILSSLEGEVEVSTEEARNYYQQNKDKFLLDERYIRFRHLIASSMSNAENAKRDLMRGYDWNKVASDYSLQPDLVIKNASKFWPEGVALKEYETLNRYLRLIGVSEISLIENINGRFHFVQLLEERAAGEHPDLEWLLEQIKEWLILEKKRVAYNTYVKNLYLAAEANNEIRSYNVLPEKFNSDITSDSLNSN